MRLKEFTIGVSNTFNLGAFESYRVEVSQTYEIAVEEQDAKDWPMRWEEMKKQAQVDLKDMQTQTYLAQQRKRKNGT